MNVKSIVFVLLCCVVNGVDCQPSINKYNQELLALKDSKQFAMLFDQEMQENLKQIQCDLINNTQLSLCQRITKYLYLGSKGIVVISTALPRLYTYVQDLSQKQAIPMPIIFIVTDKELFEAKSYKPFNSVGIIALSDQLIQQATDSEIEAVIAREVGHIKYQHANKELAFNIAAYMAALGVVHMIDDKENLPIILKIALPLGVILFGGKLLINKRFEKEADEFACKQADGSYGLQELLEHFELFERKQTAFFDDTYIKIQENRVSLGIYSYAYLMCCYYKAKTGHLIDDAFKWLSYNTPLGAYPSNRARIQTIQKYLA